MPTTPLYELRIPERGLGAHYRPAATYYTCRSCTNTALRHDPTGGAYASLSARAGSCELHYEGVCEDVAA